MTNQSVATACLDLEVERENLYGEREELSEELQLLEDFVHSDVEVSIGLWKNHFVEVEITKRKNNFSPKYRFSIFVYVDETGKCTNIELIHLLTISQNGNVRRFKKVPKHVNTWFEASVKFEAQCYAEMLLQKHQVEKQKLLRLVQVERRIKEIDKLVN